MLADALLGLQYRYNRSPEKALLAWQAAVESRSKAAAMRWLDCLGADWDTPDRRRTLLDTVMASPEWFAELWKAGNVAEGRSAAVLAWLSPVARAFAAGPRLAVISCQAGYDTLSFPRLPVLLRDAGWSVLAIVVESEEPIGEPWVAAPDAMVLEAIWKKRPPDLWLTTNFVPPGTATFSDGKPPVSVMFSATQLGLDLAMREDIEPMLEMVRHFDFMFCPNPRALESYRRLLSNGGKRAPVLVPGGYPRVDRQLTRGANVPGAEPRTPRTVVYAPAHRYKHRGLELSGLGWAPEMIEALLAAGYRVIFRPHPASFRHFKEDRELVDSVAEAHKHHPNFRLDVGRDPAPSYRESDLLLTDYSGTFLTFQAVYRRPVVFCIVHRPDEYRAVGMDFSFTDAGPVALNAREALAAVNGIFDNWQASVERAGKLVAANNYNLGTSEKYFIDHLPDFLARDPSADWVRP